jgi:hypothetical protein
LLGILRSILETLALVLGATPKRRVLGGAYHA